MVEPDRVEKASTHAPGASPVSGVVPPVEYRWKPGQSGNPGGRNNAKPISAAMNRIASMTESEIADLIAKPEKTGAEVLALAAYQRATVDSRYLTHVLDRTEGKVADTVHVEGPAQGLQIVIQEATRPTDGQSVQKEPEANLSDPAQS